MGPPSPLWLLGPRNAASNGPCRIPATASPPTSSSSSAAAEPGCCGGVGQSLAEPVGRGPAAALDEEDVGGLAVAGMRQGPLDAALRGPSSQSGEGGPIQGDGAFGAEFSQRDLQPAAVAGEIEHAVQLEVKE